MRLLVAVLLAVCSALTIATAQPPKPADIKEKEKAKEKGPLVIAPEKAVVKTGALSTRALVQKPTPVKGASGWTVETKQHRMYINTAALSPDGTTFATGGIDGTIRFWDADTGAFKSALVGHDSYVYGLAFSADGKYLASSGSFDATIRIWDAKTGLPLRMLKGVPDFVGPVVWTPDGRGIVTGGGASGTIYLFDLATGKVKHKAEVSQAIRNIAITPDGKTAIVVAKGQAPARFDLESGVLGNKRIGEANAEYQGVAVSADGKLIACCTDKDTRLFDAETGTQKAKLSDAGLCVAFPPDGKTVAVSGMKGTFIYPVDATEPTVKTPAGLSTIAFGPEGKRLVGTNASKAGAWEAADGALKWAEDLGVAGSLVWSPGRPLITGAGTSTLTLWDPVTLQKTFELTGHADVVTAFAWSPDGKLLATTALDKTVRLWNPTTGESVRTFDEHKKEVRAVAWGTDGKSLATAADDGALVWDPSNSKVIHKLPGHDHAVLAIAIASQSKQIATGDSDGKVRVFSPTGTLMKDVLEPEGVVAVGLAPDGKLLLASPKNNVTRLWNLTSGKATLELPIGTPAHATMCAVSPSGGTMAVARANFSVILLDLKLGQVTKGYNVFAPPVSVAWGTGGTLLGAACDDRVTRFLDPATGQSRGAFVLEKDGPIALAETGHLKGPDANLIYIVQTPTGQETVTPADFATKFGWKNLPANAKPGGK